MALRFDLLLFGFRNQIKQVIPAPFLEIKTRYLYYSGRARMSAIAGN